MDREKFASRRLGRSSSVINTEFGCVCMESVQSAQGGPNFHYTSVECRSSSHTKKTEIEEVKKLKAIKEVFFREWLSNTVVVKKKIGKWRVCVDFTNLNRACSKDPFPVPKID